MTVVLCIGQTPHSAFGAPFGSMLDRDPVQLLGGFVTRLLAQDMVYLGFSLLLD